MLHSKVGLIGFSGSGKSAVISKAALRGYKVVDTDLIISETEGSFPDSMLLDGKEKEFRKLEAVAVRTALSTDVDFIAFGGGVHSANPVFKEIVNSGVKLVFLKGSFDVVFQRAWDRPLFKKLGLAGYRKLFEEREPFYLKASEYIVDVDKKTLEDVFEEVEKIWNLTFR